MQKCWFALEQTHYVPPTTKSMYRGKPTGPLSLGHIVPSLKKLDQVINAGEMEPIPWGMEIIGPNRMVNFKWSEERRQDLALDLRASAPITGMIPGFDGFASIGGMFAKKVQNHWDFECLETYIIQPTRMYVYKSVEGRAVQEYLERNKRLGILNSATLYMITGLAVARGKTTTVSTTGREHGVVGGVGVEVPALLEVGPQLGLAGKKVVTNSRTQETDFIWAVRLSKIYNKILQKDWRVELCEGRIGTRGAVMSTEDNLDVKRVLADHGLENPEVVQEPGTDIVFVDPSSGEDEELDE